MLKQASPYEFGIRRRITAVRDTWRKQCRMPGLFPPCPHAPMPVLKEEIRENSSHS